MIFAVRCDGEYSIIEAKDHGDARHAMMSMMNVDEYKDIQTIQCFTHKEAQQVIDRMKLFDDDTKPIVFNLSNEQMAEMDRLNATRKGEGLDEVTESEIFDNGLSYLRIETIKKIFRDNVEDILWQR